MLQTVAFNYKLIKKIKDERFDEDLIHQYHLLIHIGTRDFQAAIVDPDSDRLLLLEDYVLPNLVSYDDLLQSLAHLFDAHPFLKAGFWKKVSISIKNQKFIQVPEPLFSEDALFEYLKFNAAVDPEHDELVYVKSPAAEVITVFAVQKQIKKWLDEIYPGRQHAFIHQSATMIEGVLQYSKKRNDNPLYIYVDRFRLHILSCDKGKLIYYNQFLIKQFSDYIKYIMLVMKSLNMDQQTSQVVLWGYIGKNSPHYHEFYKYINNVIFGERPDHLHFGYMFDEIQEHHFFDLYSLYLVRKS